MSEEQKQLIREKLADIEHKRWAKWQAYLHSKLYPLGESEQIIKIGRIVYMKLFDDFGNVVLNDEECFCDKKGEYDCKKIFWRFYWIYDRTYKN